MGTDCADNQEGSGFIAAAMSDAGSKVHSGMSCPLDVPLNPPTD